jgi:hypothetical protein
LLPHADAGQKGALSLAMHEPFQRGALRVPFQILHDTSSYSPSIARRVLLGKNAFEAPVREHRSKLRRLVLFSAYHAPNEKGKNALHGHVEFVARMGDRLPTPMWVRRGRVSRIIIKAQIVDLHHDFVSERALRLQIVWVTGWGYFEAAPASVAKTRIGTKCKLVDRRSEPSRDVYAARCKRKPCSAWSTEP